MTVCRDRGPLTVTHPDDLGARGDILWASSIALCGLTGAGKVHDWASHVIEHELSARYDLTHGVGLAILTPAWMRQVLSEDNAHRFARFGHVMWGLDENGGMEAAQEAIDRLGGFFVSLGLPATLSEVGIGGEAFEAITKACTSRGPLGGFGKLQYDDVKAILESVR